MDRVASLESEARFSAYVEGVVGVIGHADRAEPLRDYCLGLLLPGERKSVEPMAAVTAPGRVAAQHQALLHFVGNAPWLDEAVLGRVRELVLPAVERSGPIEAWIVDDTGFPKKGRHSVGVARQYCGQLGKRDNCQSLPRTRSGVAVTLSIANHGASLPVAYRLYLPEEWADDPLRRAKAGVPPEVAFATQPEIALAQIRAACAAGIARGVVLMDAGYGADTKLRGAIAELGLRYAAGILPNTTVWPQGKGPLPPKPWTGRDRPASRLRRDAEHRPVQVKALALDLPASAWETVTWREGSADWLSSRYARMRIRAAHRDQRLKQPPRQEWLLIEWPEGEAEPTKYWLSSLPEDIALADLVDRTKLRWRIERDYQDLKQEVGLGHYEGRGWRGFHHHATLCIAAYGFLISGRETIPPSASCPAANLPKPVFPAGYRPRGAADPARTPHPQLDRHLAQTPHRRSRRKPSAMPMLQHPAQANNRSTTLMTQ